MALETVTFIDDLVATNPVGGTDPKSEGDDHIRNIKSAILATFPNIDGAMTRTQSQLNNAPDSTAAETIAGAWTFSGQLTFSYASGGGPAGGIVLQNTYPVIFFDETGAPANRGRWALQATGNELVIVTYNDADAAVTQVFRVQTDASGAVDNCDFTNGALNYNGVEVGYRQLPQNSQSGPTYVCVAADEGRHILHPAGAGAGDTFTIPANASVAFPIGAALTFINRDTNAVSIAITTDTMYLAGSTSTGTRTLAENGIATAIKTGATEWIINGIGLT